MRKILINFFFNESDLFIHGKAKQTLSSSGPVDDKPLSFYNNIDIFQKGYILEMQKQFFKYITQSVAAMIGFSIYILADTFFISVQSGADGLAVLNLILPVYGLVYAIGSMIGIGSATRYAIDRSRQENTDFYFTQSVFWGLQQRSALGLPCSSAPHTFLEKEMA